MHFQDEMVLLFFLQKEELRREIVNKLSVRYNIFMFLVKKNKPKIHLLLDQLQQTKKRITHKQIMNRLLN